MYICPHEPKRIVYELEKNGIPIEVKKLDIGDYLFSNVIIERKTIQDYLSSIYSHRIYNQLHNLQQYDKPILFIIGDIPPVYRWVRFKKRTVKMLLSKEEQNKRMKTIRINNIIAFLSFGVQVFYVKDEDEFIKYVTELFFNSTRDKERLKPIKKKGHSIEEVKINIYGSLSGIGAKTAKMLSKKYSVRKFCNLGIKDLVKIPRIGKNKAKQIIKEITT